MSRVQSPGKVETFMFAYNYMQPSRRLEDVRRAAAEAAARKASRPSQAGASKSLVEDAESGDAGDEKGGPRRMPAMKLQDRFADTR